MRSGHKRQQLSNLTTHNNKTAAGVKVRFFCCCLFLLSCHLCDDELWGYVWVWCSSVSHLAVQEGSIIDLDSMPPPARVPQGSCITRKHRRTHVFFFSYYCTDLYTTNSGIKWSCHSVTSQLIRCQIVLNLDNSGDLPDYMAASEVKLCKLYMIGGCVDAVLVLKPADYSMISMPYFPVTT